MGSADTDPMQGSQADPWEGATSGRAKRAGQGAIDQATRNGWLAAVVSRDSRQWVKGAVGERWAATYLARLPDDFGVWHDLTFPGSQSNLDHLVVGPTGVFAINTKYHMNRKVKVYGEKVYIDGYPNDYPRALRREAVRTGEVFGAAGLEKPWVVPVLAVFCDEWTVKKAPNGVVVTRGAGVADAIQSADGRLDPARIRRLRAVAVEWAAT